MPAVLNAPQLLARDFLEIRAKILEVAACLDRIERADGSVSDDPRLAQIRAGLETLLADADGSQVDGGRNEHGRTIERGGRAEQVQMIFSLPYEEGWRKKWSV
jgi:hypothetical protein